MSTSSTDQTEDNKEKLVESIKVSQTLVKVALRQLRNLLWKWQKG
jgi:hypothetical protein